MKSFLSKVGLGAVALTACFLVSSTQAQVYSVNVVGFNKTTLGPGDLVMMTTPFLVDTQDVNGVIGEQLTPGTDLSADTIFVWDGMGFKNLIRIPDLGGSPFDNLWTDVTDPNNPAVSADPLAPGLGVYVRNNQSITQEVVVVGEVVTNASVDVNVPIGLNMISYPYSSSFNLGTNDSLRLSGAFQGTDLSADTIFLWDTDAGAFKTHICIPNLGGSPFDDRWTDVTDPNAPAVAGIVEAGQAFFYRRQAAAGSALTWTETIPYTLD